MTHSTTPSRSRRVGATIATGAVLSLVATAAGAAVTPGDDPLALAGAITTTAPAGATLAVDHDCHTDPTLCPSGVGTTPLSGFPTAGSTYAILTTGSAALADQPTRPGGRAERIVTPYGTGSASIGGGAAGALTVGGTPAGVAAVKAAAEQPWVLRQAARKLARKAAKLERSARSAAPAKARKLTTKAKKLAKRSASLRKRAAATARQPLGTMAVTVTNPVTNPVNGRSEVLRLQLPR